MAQSDEIRAQVLPVYFVADQSSSMHRDIREVNNGLTSLLDAMAEQSDAASMVRFTIVGFSNQARCLLELADFRDHESMPVLTANGSTAYSAAFRDLRSRIPQNVQTLADEGNRVFRPVVFFLTDGEPNSGDPWIQTLSELRDPEFRQRPNILAFGVRDAKAEIIGKIATQEGYAYLAAKGSDTGAAIAEFFIAFTQSVVESGRNLAEGHGDLVMEEPEGFIKIKVDGYVG